MLNIAEFLFDLGLGQGIVGGQIDQVLFLDVEAAKLGSQLLVEEPSSGILVFECGGDVSPDVSDEVGAELDGGVVRLDGVFDADDVDMRGKAGAVLLVAAEKVGVFASSGIHGVLDDQALGNAGLAAAAAEQRAF